jgi:hypothetical protein
MQAHLHRSTLSEALEQAELEFGVAPSEWQRVEECSIPVGVVGTITSPGERCGWSVKIEDDAENTGGFLILEWNDALGEGYDCWAESRSRLSEFFSERGWEVRWSGAAQSRGDGL